MNTMEYKGYIGSVDFSEEDQVLHGKVLGIRSLVSYEGTSVKSLIKDFHHSVDLYLENCKESGTKPETAYKGSFNVRIPSDMHKKAAMAAMSRKESLNRYVEEAISSKIEKDLIEV
ncbi:MAG: type II toxin-antitoxin system HicB family antitoxin [Lachnospiraceae bacterium]|jgi:predicted HicB family RNase H-like nuclease|nr:type II toxin-antitoxin system HicB family antitoxin [Lachnospiraceae bacterium]